MYVNGWYRCRNILFNLKKKKAEYDQLMEKLQREVINSLDTGSDCFWYNVNKGNVLNTEESVELCIPLYLYLNII